MARDGWHTYLPSSVSCCCCCLLFKQKEVLLCASGAAVKRHGVEIHGMFVELTNEGPDSIFPYDFYLMPNTQETIYAQFHIHPFQASV